MASSGNMIGRRCGRAVAGVVGAAMVCGGASGQIRMVTYNLLNRPDTSGQTQQFVDVFDRIADDTSRVSSEASDRLPPAIIMLQEADSSVGALRAGLESLYGLQYSSFFTTDAPSNDDVGVLYDRDYVTLVGTRVINKGVLGGPRSVPVFTFRPAGQTSDVADFHVYVAHLKAGSSGSDISTRAGEGTALRADMDGLGADARIVFGGDFNAKTPSEAVINTLLASGPGRLIDPLNRMWSGRALTQDPQTGLNDRFDLIVHSDEMVDGGMDYIAGSYFVYGNNNGSVSDADTQVSDHLPVVSDYRVPALPEVLIRTSTVPSRVVRGADILVLSLVGNGAAVRYGWGADELIWRVVAPGLVGGAVLGRSVAGEDASLAVVELDTSVAGFLHGDVRVQIVNADVAQTQFVSDPVEMTVLSPSVASWTASGVSTMASVGLLANEGDSASVEKQLFNVEEVAGFGAAMDVDGVTVGGDVDAFEVVGPAGPIGAGESAGVTVSLADGLGAGEYSATVTIGTSDENVPGGSLAGSSQVVLMVSAEVVGVVGCDGDATGDGLVSLADFSVVLSNFGGSGGLSDGDVSGDGLISLADFSIVLSNFGVSCGG